MLARANSVAVRGPPVLTEVDLSYRAFETMADPWTGSPIPPAPVGVALESPLTVKELREPLDRIVESLHRLSLPDTFQLQPAPDSPLLLHRARTLATELRGVVDALLGPDGDGRRGERRVRSETLSVVAAFEDAAAQAGDTLSGRHVTVSCPPRLTVTTDAARFGDLLSLLLRESAREPGEVHATVGLDSRELVVTFAGLRSGAHAGRSLDGIQALAAQLGGRIDVVAHPEHVAGIRVRLPQQRTRRSAQEPTLARTEPAPRRAR